MLGLRLVVGNVILSMRPGGGDALTRGLTEVHRKINDIHTYDSEVVKLNSERKQSRDSFFNPKEFIRISCIVAKCWKIAFQLQVVQTQYVIITLNEPSLAFLKATLEKWLLRILNNRIVNTSPR